MKKNLLSALFPLVIFLSISFSSSAATHVIEATDSLFTPDSLTVMVGDTIQWNWIEGNHTTSSNGIPLAAEPWNALLDSTHTSYKYFVADTGWYNYISVPDAPGMHGKFYAYSTTAIANVNSFAPALKILSNPVHDQLMFSFSLPSSNSVSIELFDVLGRKMQTLLNEKFSSGIFNQSAHLNNYHAGYYFLVMQVGTATLTEKVVIE